MCAGISDQLSRHFIAMSVLCSWLICFIHVGFSPSESTLDWWLHELLVNGICRIAVPFFFLSAGFFWASNATSAVGCLRAIRKRFVTLVIPYVLWAVIYCGFRLLLNYVLAKVKHGEFAVDMSLVDVFGLKLLEMPCFFPLWFLRDLFLLIVVSSVLFLYVNTVKRFLFCTVGILVLREMARRLGFYGLDGYIGVFCSPMGSAYFLLGACLRREGVVFQIDKNLIWGVGILTTIVMVWAKSTACFELSRYLSYIMIPLLLAGVWMIVPVAKVSRIAIVPIGVYLLHLFVINCMEPIVGFFDTRGMLRSCFFGYVIRGLVVVLVASLLSGMLVRLKVFRFLFGGRVPRCEIGKDLL